MKQLLYKEFKLTGALITYLFLLFTLMAFIPSYPILLSVFFICMGIFYTFQYAREYNDTVYTALLPVSKRDIVKAKFLFVVILQITAFILLSVFSVLRMTLLNGVGPYAATNLMNPNFAFLGYALIGFAIFNLIFLKGFFKTGYNIGKPFLFFCFAEFAFINITEILHFIPGLTFLNEMSGTNLLYQIFVLGAGILTYIIVTILSYKKSAATFNKIDI